ncbi:MAG: cupin domain-containing protein [Actinomycetia bacterium]|nr:cupin domain-containing protein [Actinomycetes bacterium]
METLSPLDTGPGRDLHADAEEHFLLLTGEVTFHMADQTFIVRPGDFLHVLRGVVHHFRVLTPDAKIIATYAPAGEEQTFIDAATLLPGEA